MVDLDRFEELVIEALNNVPRLYYTTVYKNIESFKSAFWGIQGHLNDDKFERYGERVFCYEFYHQLRILIDNERLVKPEFLSGANLQGEVNKMQLIELAKSLVLDPLSNRFVPDFLMHSAGDSSTHAFVIEVKCVNDLSWHAMFSDLLKINQFIERYHYQRGLFITVNSQPEYIEGIMQDNESKINQLEGKESIKVINKQSQESELKIFYL